MSALKPCPCGGTHFVRTSRVSGPWLETLDSDGQVIDSDLDNLKYSAQPKTVKCENCGKRQPNPDFAKDAQ